MLAPWKKSYDQSRQHIKKQRYYFANKGLFSQSYGFSTSCVWCESWTIKKAEHRRTDAFELVLKKILESPFYCKQIQQVNPKGNQSWVFIGKTAAEAEAPILWPSDLKNWLPWKRPWCWERLKAGGKGDNRGWDGWMTSPTWCTLVWVISGSWWWTGKPGLPQSMGSEIVRHYWMTELNWTSEGCTGAHSSKSHWICLHPTSSHPVIFLGKHVFELASKSKTIRISVWYKEQMTVLFYGQCNFLNHPLSII